MKPLVFFGIMADCQYANADYAEAIVLGTDSKYENNYRMAPIKMREAVDEFNKHTVEFIVHLGDFIDRNLDEADVLLGITKDSRAPLWHVLGNHDFSGSRGNEERVLKKYKLRNAYYSKIVNNYRFIVLDTNDVGVIKYAEGSDEWKQGRAYLDKLKADGVPQVYDWNGGVGKQQREWLESELSEAQSTNEKVILFSHHAVFPPHRLNALNDSEMLGIIDRYPNVIAYINGHNHMGAFGERKGVLYLTVPGMLQGDTNAFGIVNVYGNRIEIKGYERVQDMVIGINR